MRTKLTVVAGIVVIVGSLAAFAWVKAQNGFSARDEPSALEKFAAETMRSVSMPSAAKALESPSRIDDERLAGARMHWADHCALCHANDGSGNTPIGRGLFPKPPDMRSKVSQAKTDGELFFIIENGIRLTGMPAWGNGGSHSEESWALVAFIRQLPNLTPEEVKAMEAMNPRSAHESMEEKEEEEFLRGDSPSQE